MNELVVIAEGETEQTFVRDQLAGHLALFNTAAWAVLPGRRRNQGGVKKWQVAKQDIIRTLREQRFCTTMIDYYAMPDDWPGREEASSLPWNERASFIEGHLERDIAESMGGRFNPIFFVPYIQLHEFESLAFSDTEKLASVLAPLSNIDVIVIQAKLDDILANAGHPEALNDGYETCPSRRIEGIVRAYKKRVHGPIVTQRIGLPGLREACPHFSNWVEKLEAIGGR